MGSQNFTFRNQYVTPPSKVYIEQNGGLRLTVRTIQACVVTVSWRILQKDAQGINVHFGSQPFTPASAAGDAPAGNITSIAIGEGFLLSVYVSVESVDPIVRGMTFIVLEAMRDIGQAIAPTIVEALLSHYVTTGSPISFPETPIENPTDGAGVLRVVSNNIFVPPALPQAFAFSLSLRTSIKWMIVQITNANAGDIIECILATAGAVSGAFPQSLALVAGTNKLLYAPNIQHPSYASTIGEAQFIPLPRETLMFPANATLLFDELAGHAPNFAISAFVEQWISF